MYNTELIYSRVIGLQASSRDVSINEVMSCELSPVPTALFSDSGEMRIAKSKLALKNLTKVDVSARHATQDSTCTVMVALYCGFLSGRHPPQQNSHR